MELFFLGTSCMVPTKDRNVTGTFLSYKDTSILIDCGEGTQRQMNIMGLNRNKINIILITHWHGDHVGGLVSLLQTISNSDNPSEIEIYGPKGTKKRISHLFDSIVFERSTLNLKVKDLNPRKVEFFKETNDYFLECAPMSHSTPCIGYSFIEKDVRMVNLKKAESLGLKQGPLIGKLKNGSSVVVNGLKIKPDDISRIKKGRKLSFIFDTIPTSIAFELAKNADLLVSEAVYLPDLIDKAEKNKHLTTKDAGIIATKAGVKKLIITHFSQRYKTCEDLQESVKTYFANSECAYDFMKVKL